MNMSRFTSLLNKDVRWRIYIIVNSVLHYKTLVDPAQHEKYLKISMNNEDNKLPFLDAEIVLRCLKAHYTEGFHHNKDGDIQNLIEAIERELKYEEIVACDALTDIMVDYCSDEIENLRYDAECETRKLERIFTDDPNTCVIRKHDHGWSLVDSKS